MPVTIAQLISEQKTLDQHRREFAASLKPELATLGYTLVPLITVTAAKVYEAPTDLKQSIKRRGFTCPKCDRRFEHAMHLGRHVSAGHKHAK
jgi:hypothetical protein